MQELCARSAEDDSVLQSKIVSFFNDRNIDTVTGIRRMGRDNLVDFVMRMATDAGYSCSLYPDVSGNDIVFFYTWEGMEQAMRSVAESDSPADVIFGQDLCHQVPAVVRFRK